MIPGETISTTSTAFIARGRPPTADPLVLGAVDDHKIRPPSCARLAIRRELPVEVQVWHPSGVGGELAPQLHVETPHQ